MGLVSLLFGFRGRINRVQFWLGNLGAGFGIIILVSVLTLLGGAPAPAMTDQQKLAHFVSTFALALFPALLIGSWCGFALQWKRFHDRGRSGVWVFLPMLPSFMMVSSVFGAIATGAHPAVIAQAAQPWATILWIIQLGMLIDLGLLPGKEGPNKYGDPPGSGSSVSAPTAPTAPTAPAKAPQPHAIPGMGAGLGGVESAMERAIAERAKAQRAASAAAARTPAPANGLRPATPASFGRKVTQ